MKNENSRPWENYTPPGGQIRIEGTMDVPLVTDQPVEIIPKKKKLEKQSETLIPVEAIEAKDVHKEKPAATKRKPRPYRARYKDTTDYVIRALKTESNEETEPSNPDADIDEIFGADQAKRIL